MKFQSPPSKTPAWSSKEKFQIQLGTTTLAHEIQFDNSTVDLTVADQALSPAPSGDAKSFKLYVDSLATVLLVIARKTVSPTDYRLIRLLIDAHEIQKKGFDSTLLLSDFAQRLAAGHGDAAKELFVDLVDSLAQKAAGVAGTVIVGAMLIETGPGGAYLGGKIGGTAAEVLYDAAISSYVKSYAAQLWDSLGNDGGPLDGGPQQLLHGPISGATVFADTNGDGILSPGEAHTTTDANGWFLLPPTPGSLVSVGGVDTTTGLPIALTLHATEGSSIVSPLTSVAAELANQGYADPASLLFPAFDLNPPTGEAAYDPVGAAMDGDASALKQFAIDGKIYATALAIETAVSERFATSEAAATDAVFAALASKIIDLMPGSVIDLDNLGEIEGLVSASTNALGLLSFSSAESEAIATVVTAFNKLMTQALTNQDTVGALAQITQIEKVAEGLVAHAIADLISGALSAQQLVSTYSGASLEALVLDPPTLSIAPEDATLTEGNSGTQAFSFVVTQAGNSSVSHDVLWSVSGTGTHAADQADFGGAFPVDVLTFAPGETSKTITVFVSGDTGREANEHFVVSLSGPSPGLVIATSVAIGTIQNDDISAVTLIGGAGNDVLLSSPDSDLVGQAYRLYGATLDREPDPGGLDYWVGQLEGDVGVEDAAGGFTGSPEFQGKYGAVDDMGFVTLLYNNVLHRAPDPGGEAYWLNLLDTGSSRTTVVVGFSESPEYKGNEKAGLEAYVQNVAPWQSNVLDGGAGTDTVSYALAHGGVTVNLGITGPQETLGAGIDTLTSIENLTGSPFDDTLTGNADGNAILGGAGNDILSGGLESDWVGQAYRLYGATLDREPDSGGLDYWVGLLKGGMSIEDAAGGFTNSPEFQAKYGALDDTQFATLLYGNVLDRAPDLGGLAYWLNLLGTGTSRTEVVAGFSDSPEYQGNEKPGTPGLCPEHHAMAWQRAGWWGWN